MSNFVAQSDLRLAKIAARQHGVVSVGQLREVGLDKHAVHVRSRAGRLHPLHRGVYAVGHAGISRQGRWLAAVLACGKGAVLSHRSAAALWDLLPPPDGPVDVSTPERGGRARRSGIRLHRYLSLTRESTMRRFDIPVTTPARTIADLRGVLPAWQWRRAVRQAEIAGLRLGREIETDRTRSDLERDFLRLCRRHGLPKPEVNVRVGRWTVDFLWRSQRVAVETGTYGFHRGTVAFEDDHARDMDLRRRGFDVRRFTRLQVENRPEAVAMDLRDALGERT